MEAVEKSPAHPERVPFSAGQIASAVASTRDFIADRPGELASFLGVATPAAPPSQPCPPPTQRRDHEPPADAAPSTPASSASTSPVSPGVLAPLRLDRFRAGPHAVRLRVTAPAAGEVVLHGWVGTGGKHTNACVPARLRASTPGGGEITCKLTDPALRRHAKRRLRLHLKVDFLPSSGARQEIRRALTLPRHTG